MNKFGFAVSGDSNGVKRENIGRNAPGIDIGPNSDLYKKVRNNIAMRFYDLMKSA